MEGRSQPERRARSVSRSADELRSEEEEDVEDIQNKLDRLLGRDSDSDQSYVPSSDDDEARERERKGNTSEKEPVSSASDDSDIEALREKYREKSKKRKNITKPSVSSEAKTNYVKELNSIPSKMKNIADSSCLESQGTRFSLSKQILIEEIIQMIPREDPEDCCRILIELMSLPHDFWKTENVKSVGHEELGLAVVDVVHRFISNKTLFLQTILTIGKIGLEWREGTRTCRETPKTPRTFLSCCSVLISAGDLAGLTELFQDYEPVKGEVEECGVMRCVVSMMKASSAESQENLSVAGSSSVNTGAGHLPPDIIIETLSFAVRKPGADVEWFLPLLCDYMMGRLRGRT